jgi:hypothetical protein
LIEDRITDEKTRAAVDPEWMCLKRGGDGPSQRSGSSGIHSHKIRTAWMRCFSSDMLDNPARPSWHTRSKNNLSADRWKKQSKDKFEEREKRAKWNEIK